MQVDTRPERMLLLIPGAPARIEVSVPFPELTDNQKLAGSDFQLATTLRVLNASGTVVASGPVLFQAPDTTQPGALIVTMAELDEPEATRAALALAGHDGRWELVCDNCPSSSSVFIESGPAHSTVQTKRRARIPMGCRNCGSPAAPPPVESPVDAPSSKTSKAPGETNKAVPPPPPHADSDLRHDRSRGDS